MFEIMDDDADDNDVQRRRDRRQSMGLLYSGELNNLPYSRDMSEKETE